MAIIRPNDGLYFLPHVFHVADLAIRFGWKPHAALRQIFIWKVQGHVKELGGKSGVFANLVAAPYPDWELGLRMIMPTAVIVGVEVLRRAGWTTQIPYVPTVAVDLTQRIHQVAHFEVVALPSEWFDSVARGIRGGENVALPHLAPAWALADLIRREGWCDCGLGPDDIYWEAVTEEDRADWIVACTALRLGRLPMNPDTARDWNAVRWPSSAPLNDG